MSQRSLCGNDGNTQALKCFIASPGAQSLNADNLIAKTLNPKPYKPLFSFRQNSWLWCEPVRWGQWPSPNYSYYNCFINKVEFQEYLWHLLILHFPAPRGRHLKDQNLPATFPSIQLLFKNQFAYLQLWWRTPTAPKRIADHPLRAFILKRANVMWTYRLMSRKCCCKIGDKSNGFIYVFRVCPWAHFEHAFVNPAKQCKHITWCWECMFVICMEIHRFYMRFRGRPSVKKP